ncbi:MAG TPA: thiamine phosphate synthase [Candidatus Acidoferrales bacterium]|nr:thiamine phosphate synthase [Candidatus Acidoferrales bacterium]
MFPSLYAILDQQFIKTSVVNYAKDLVDAGVELIQYRAKGLSPRAYFATCATLTEALANANARLIINDRPDIAAMVGAGGVHVGQDDLAPGDARKICGASRWVGVSTHNFEQVRAAAHAPVDYIALGPIFPTATKRKPDPVVGTSLIREARKLTEKPIVAIGGITLERATEVFAAGANSVAVIRDLLDAPDPIARAREFLAVAAKSRASSCTQSRFGNSSSEGRNDG